MILESHSLKTAVARFHLTTPQALRELQTKGEADAATRQIETLRKELEAIEDVDRADFEALRRLGFSTRAGPASTTSTIGDRGRARRRAADGRGAASRGAARRRADGRGAPAGSRWPRSRADRE